MKKLWIVFLAISRTALISALGVLIVVALMTWRLTTLTPGLSEVEVNTYNSASSVSAIVNNMVNAPYKSAVFVSTSILDNTFGLRIVGALVGSLAIIIFYLLARQIFGRYVALATTAMFAGSSMLLGMSRSANNYVMLLSLLAIIACGFYIRFGKRSDIGWVVTATVLGLSLYVPGMIIFILAAAFWQFGTAKKTFERLQTPFIIASSVVFGLLCVPIFISLFSDPSLWRQYLGLPTELAPVVEMLKYMGSVVTSLFIYSPQDVRFWLGRQPILDVFATAMFIFGTYNIIKNHKLDRLWTIAGIFILGIVWIGVTTNHYGILLLLPFVYLVIGTGLQSLIDQWFSVFPKNPIARYTGAALVLIAIVASVNFQLHRYFVAWPNNDATKEAFSLQLPN